MNLVQTVRMLLGSASPSNEVVKFWVESTKSMILNYCNLETLPDELNTLVVEITTLRIQSNSQGVGKGTRVVASVTDGSQSVSYSNVGQKSITSDEDILNNYKAQLNRFRRLKW